MFSFGMPVAVPVVANECDRKRSIRAICGPIATSSTAHAASAGTIAARTSASRVSAASQRRRGGSARRRPSRRATPTIHGSPRTL